MVANSSSKIKQLLFIYCKITSLGPRCSFRYGKYVGTFKKRVAVTVSVLINENWFPEYVELVNGMDSFRSVCIGDFMRLYMVLSPGTL